MTAAMMVAVLASHKGRRLSGIIDELPAYNLIKEKYRTKEPHAVVRAVEEAFSGEKIEKIDGIKILRENAWALVRPSGTEPMVRIMVEAKDPRVADGLYHEIAQVLAKRVPDAGAP